jgi:hypothetical protein
MPVDLEVKLSEFGRKGYIKINGQEISCSRLKLDIVPGEPFTAEMRVLVDDAFYKLELDKLDVYPFHIVRCPECGEFVSVGRDDR